MNTTDIDKTHHYWHELLNMNVLSKTETDLKLSYGDEQAFVAFKKIGKFSYCKHADMNKFKSNLN